MTSLPVSGPIVFPGEGLEDGGLPPAGRGSMYPLSLTDI